MIIEAKTMKKISLFLCCIAAAFQVHAGGYRVAIQGQKALGMAHAGVAMTDSAEAVFFNPAAMIQLDSNLQVTSGLALIYTKNRYQNTDTGSYSQTDTPLGTPVNFFVASKISPNLSVGFGLYTPYGSKVEWETDWVGSHLVNNIDLQSIFLQPTVAYKVNDKFSVGGGPIIAISSVELNRNLNTSLQDENGDRSNVTIEDSGIIDYGYSLGVFFKLTDKLNYGINYRSEIIVKSEGDADFENLPAALSAAAQNGGYTAKLPLPAELTLGLTYQLNEKALLAFDYNYTFWDVYKDLTFNFDSLNAPFPNPSSNPRNYKNSSTYRLGLQYQQNAKLQLRGGIYYDQTPIRDGYFAPETPRGDSLGFTAGMTLQLSKNLEMDVSGLYLYFDEEENSYDFSSEGQFAGEYKVSAWALGLGVSYQF
ncbi:MAG: long-chain fatty acid transport protein [Cellvibrionaceae bacterium]|jgi:long-chain fatty acid transport protein